MSTAVIFHGLNALDFEELRMNALRIPEVLSRVRKAQKIWDEAGLPSFDFVNFIGSDNKIFYSNIKLKSLTSAIVQVGLYERLVAKLKEPQFLLGDMSGDSAMMYICGKVTFPELILSSSAARASGQGFTLAPDQRKLSSGVGVAQLGLMKLEEEAIEVSIDEEKNSPTYSVSAMVRHLVDEQNVKKFINVGPGSTMESLRKDFEMEELTFMESVDCDPMLNWFWSHLNPLEFQVAQ